MISGVQTITNSQTSSDTAQGEAIGPFTTTTTTCLCVWLGMGKGVCGGEWGDVYVHQSYGSYNTHTYTKQHTHRKHTLATMFPDRCIVESGYAAHMWYIHTILHVTLHPVLLQAWGVLRQHHGCCVSHTTGKGGCPPWCGCCVEGWVVRMGASTRQANHAT